MAEKSGSTLFARLSIVEWIALLGALSLGYSFFWEWGFWSALDVSLREIPISSADIVGSLAWVEGLIIVIIGTVTLIAFGRRAEGYKSEDELIRGSPFPRFTKLIWRGTDIFLPIMIVLAVGTVAYRFGKVPPMLLFLFVFVAWHYFINWAFNHPRAPRNVPLFLFCYFAPVFFLLQPYVLGREAAGDTIAEKETASVFLMTGKTVQKKQLILLRNSHDFVYAYDSENGLL